MAGKQNIGITEFTTAHQGAPSPFGDELSLPLPVEAIRYTHPRPEERPVLAAESERQGSQRRRD